MNGQKALEGAGKIGHPKTLVGIIIKRKYIVETGMKTLLIFSKNSSVPSLLAQTTRSTLQKLYPDATIQYSSTLDINNMQSDGGFTIVIPGDYLPFLNEAMNENGARNHAIEAVKDLGANYIGFCAGAMYGAEYLTAGKSYPNPYHSFSRDEFLDASHDYALGMIEGSHAVGPFLPYQNAAGGRNKTYSHEVIINDGPGYFSSLYIEGPMFFNKDLTGPYAIKENVVANYFMWDEPKISFNIQGEEKQATTGCLMPAMLHQEVKVSGNNSHRSLVGFHPELASSARDFIPNFEKTFCPTYAEKMRQEDRVTLMSETVENANLDFLKKKLTF